MVADEPDRPQRPEHIPLPWLLVAVAWAWLLAFALWLVR